MVFVHPFLITLTEYQHVDVTGIKTLPVIIWNFHVFVVTTTFSTYFFFFPPQRVAETNKYRCTSVRPSNIFHAAVLGNWIMALKFCMRTHIGVQQVVRDFQAYQTSTSYFIANLSDFFHHKYYVYDKIFFCNLFLGNY